MQPRSALMDVEPGSPEGEELDILVDLVEIYESKDMMKTCKCCGQPFEVRRADAMYCSQVCKRRHYRHGPVPAVPAVPDPVPDNLEVVLKQLEGILTYLNDVRWQLTEAQRIDVRVVMRDGGWRREKRDERMD
jgi:hypothetical protein